jgi:hypothetical protein
MKTTLSTILILSTFCALTAGCVSIRATEPEACLSQSVSLPGAPAQIGGLVGTVSESKEFKQDLGDIPSDLVTTLILTGGEISVQGTTLDFLDELKVTLLGDPAIVLVDAKPEPGATSVTIPKLDQNIADRLKDKSVDLQLDITGRLPQQDFSLDVSLCLAAEVDKQIKF